MPGGAHCQARRAPTVRGRGACSPRSSIRMPPPGSFKALDCQQSRHSSHRRDHRRRLGRPGRARPAKSPNAVNSRLLVALLATPLWAQSFVVDINNEPGTNFTQISHAVAAVPDGATLLVRSGDCESFFVDGKGLTLIGTESSDSGPATPGGSITQSFRRGRNAPSTTGCKQAVPPAWLQ